MAASTLRALDISPSVAAIRRRSPSRTQTMAYRIVAFGLAPRLSAQPSDRLMKSHTR